ncbi:MULTISPECIES: 50S ribosomal protein L22 [Globicatella]|jgi:large subunit ribosomal protein L22|uniref:Large ribosomal subunit protein uL22 n=2 Tax=Globicatella sulfidifaciens TaxID=136093 RepID=A0A1T4KBG6_9LACT|nr:MULTISPECIES: 50S ribosomal protein L22 [Globicatella]MDK7630600.1 50S ribosomal protein L22 [Globicatella sanguinis]MDT2768347.1 50S ribosomal protein L22 [Globicatella sulfidifaciens]NLJ18038.1 50S ribosomal protein L22 [Globicatella sulfidifaciens]OFK55708.1 50S ribosomal protein L22 [Globicatella sp. HMSC072A10]WIK65711.1 50S ribosomal protein L22 [Globicatella sanguinis]
MSEQITSAKAIAKTVRIAPRKVRLVVDLIRGKKIGEAMAILKYTPKSASPVVEKVLKSAIANAEHNYDLDLENLYVSEAYVNEGPTMKRFRPRAKGSASPINKRTSHITIVVSEKEEA